MPSENGWEPAWVGQDRLNWVDIPGCNVQIQTQKGFPTLLLRAWIADHNAYIEPVRNGDTASYTPTNSVSTSNHLNGTAADVNWNSHPFHVKGTFSPQQMKTLREMLDFYEGTIFWAGDWQSPIDEMHVQLGYGTYDDQDGLRDFCARKIRADGFSTFRRGNKPLPGDPANVLARATGLSLSKATEILPAVRTGLQQSDCTNVRRIAMWLAQVGHESVSFQYTEEIAKNGRYAPYIGRTWIQITWDYNYREFGEWCYDKGLIRDPGFFVANPQRLADQEWAGIGAAWYWTVQRPMNDLVDAGDSAAWGSYRGFQAVTAAINGGINGLADRQARYDRALALGDELLLLLDKGQLQEETIEELLMADTLYPSVSIYKKPGEGPKYTLAQLIQSIDGFAHREAVENAALNGSLDDIDAIFKVAAGKGEYKDSWAVNHARGVLARLEKENPTALKAYLTAKGVA